MVIYKTGDLLNNPEQIRYICHSCNIKGGYKSGVAGVIRKMYPAAYFAYEEAFNAGLLYLGEVQFVLVKKNLTIGNMICQPDYGYDGKKYVSYDAVDQATKTINKKLAGQTVAFPLIGAGLGGGDWKIIERIMERNMPDITIVVFTLDGNVPQ